MNRAGNRQQAIGISAAALGVCCVKECGAVATEDTPAGIFCARCWVEIRELSVLAGQEVMTEERRRLDGWLRHERRCAEFRRVAKFVRVWLWVPELAFVAGALIYLGAVYGAAWLQWAGWM